MIFGQQQTEYMVLKGSHMTSMLSMEFDANNAQQETEAEEAVTGVLQIQ
jgi:hypothetical protein